MNYVPTPKDLNNLSSSEAFKLILKNYPLDSKNYYFAFDLIQSRSWKHNERKKLAAYYLSNLPFASNKPYMCFLKIMPLREMLEILEKKIPQESPKVELLLYHLESILHENILNIKDNALLSDFIHEQQAVACMKPKIHV